MGIADWFRLRAWHLCCVVMRRYGTDFDKVWCCGRVGLPFGFSLHMTYGEQFRLEHCRGVWNLFEFRPWNGLPCACKTGHYVQDWHPTLCRECNGVMAGEHLAEAKRFVEEHPEWTSTPECYEWNQRRLAEMEAEEEKIRAWQRERDRRMYGA